MSINLDNIKEIFHNNKEVKKIELNGNVIWQKPVARNKLYYLNGTTVTEYDFENKTTTNYTRKTGSATPSLDGRFIIGYNGDLYYGPNSDTYCYKLEIDTVNKQYNLTDMSGTLPGINGNYSVQEGNTISWTTGQTTGGDIKTWPGDEVIGTIVTKNFGSSMFAYNNKVYTWGNTDSYLYEYSNGTYTQTNIPVPVSSSWGYNAWFLNGTMYYMGTKEYDPVNNTWINKSWSGGMGSFNGSRVFTDGVDIYQVGGTGTNRNIYKLDVATSTWSVYWTVSTAIRGDYFINLNGTAQLAQTARPRN